MLVGWRRYYQLFSWEEAPLHDIVYPLSTGIIYTLIVLLWATCREKAFPAGSAEAKHVEMELKQTDKALKPFVGAPRMCLDGWRHARARARTERERQRQGQRQRLQRDPCSLANCALCRAQLNRVGCAIAAIHNLNLCLGSLVMMVGTIYEVWARSAREGSCVLRARARARARAHTQTEMHYT